MDSSIVALTNGHPLIRLLNPLNKKPFSFRKKELHLLSFGGNEYLWIITSGWMLALRGNLEGQMKGTGLFGPGEILGLIGLDGQSREVPVYVISNTQGLRIPTADFKELMEHDINLGKYMTTYACSRYAKLLDELEQSTLLGLDKRIQKFRNKTDQLFSEEGKIKVSETAIAWAVGAHPVSVCRVLKNSRNPVEPDLEKDY